jgi:hypothetical protein
MKTVPLAAFARRIVESLQGLALARLTSVHSHGAGEIVAQTESITADTSHFRRKSGYPLAHGRKTG